MRTLLPILIVLLFCGCDDPKKTETSLVPVQVDEAAAYPKQDPGTRPPVLTGFQERSPEELGTSIYLIDGVSTYGWRKVEGKGNLVLKEYPKGPTKGLVSDQETDWDLVVEHPVTGYRIKFEGDTITVNNGIFPSTGVTKVGSGNSQVVSNIQTQPVQPVLLAESDWKPATEKCKAVWTDGVLELSGGSGMIETVKEYGDFVLQLEYYTETPKEGEKGVNSGVFFRCIPGEMMNGYECQVFNDPPAEDYEKFIGTDTGGIFRRCVGRNVGPKDGQWNHLTVAARGPMIATWVNGIQTVDWTDTRKEDDNPRKGLRTKPGTIQLQGHDPATKIQFRNIRISNL